jgi:hypothetical protein
VVAAAAAFEGFRDIYNGRVGVLVVEVAHAALGDNCWTCKLDGHSKVKGVLTDLNVALQRVAQVAGKINLAALCFLDRFGVD